MSGEFGSYNEGYFHSQMEYAADDCLGGSYEITKKWGEFLNEFRDVATAISWAEACDTGESHAIIESMKKIELLEQKLRDIKQYLRPFKDVAEKLTQKSIEDTLKSLIEQQ